METLPTVTVKGEDGNALRINKSDYDTNPTAWELFDDANVSPATNPIETTNSPVPTGLMVDKTGRGDATRFYAVDATKTKVVYPGLDSDNGYATEGEAWAAIMALAAPQA